MLLINIFCTIFEVNKKCEWLVTSINKQRLYTQLFCSSIITQTIQNSGRSKKNYVIAENRAPVGENEPKNEELFVFYTFHIITYTLNELTCLCMRNKDFKWMYD